MKWLLIFVFILSSFDLDAKENDRQNVILINSADCPVQLLNASIKVSQPKGGSTGQMIARWAADMTSRPKFSVTSLQIENTIDSKESKINIESVMFAHRAYDTWNRLVLWKSEVENPYSERNIVEFTSPEADTGKFIFKTITATDLNLSGGSDWRSEPVSATIVDPGAVYTSIVWVEKVRLDDGKIWEREDRTEILNSIAAAEHKMTTASNYEQE